MPVNAARIQGFGSAGEGDADDEGQEGGFWGAFDSLRESLAPPLAMQSALDSVALALGDAIDAVIGGDDEDEEEQVREADAADMAAAREANLSPEQREAAGDLVNEFCEKFPAARVAPSIRDLEALWARCDDIDAIAIAGAVYDRLSFGSGDSGWQSRLRVLHLVEFMFTKGGRGKDAAAHVWLNAADLLRHLEKEEPKCAEKASLVIQLLSGKSEKASNADTSPENNTVKSPSYGPDGEPIVEKANGNANEKAVEEKATAKAAPQPAPVMDLLDLAAPAAPSPAVSSSAPAQREPTDLLSLSDPQPMAAPAAQPRQSSPISIAVPIQNANPAGLAPPQTATTVAGQAATLAAPPDLNLFGTPAPVSTATVAMTPAVDSFDPNNSFDPNKPATPAPVSPGANRAPLANAGFAMNSMGGSAWGNTGGMLQQQQPQQQSKAAFPQSNPLFNRPQPASTALAGSSGMAAPPMGMAAGQPAGYAWGANAGRGSDGSSFGGGMHRQGGGAAAPLPYISPSEAKAPAKLQNDPFAFVASHTGVGA